MPKFSIGAKLGVKFFGKLIALASHDVTQKESVENIIKGTQMIGLNEIAVSFTTLYKAVKLIYKIE